jgi:hypothetical protein
MIEKLFNPRKTIFLGLDELGRIQGRGRFYAEIEETEYTAIKSCVISGFKKKNLVELVSMFPNLIEVSIEKTSKLLSLEGVDRLVDLRKITIQDCPNLKDLSSLKSCTNLAEVQLSMFKTPTDVLGFLNAKVVSNLALNGNITDMSLIGQFNNLDYLNLNGYGCDTEVLPSLPKVRKNFNLEGFPKLKDASFMENLDATVRISWWGPKPIKGIPAQLSSLKTFN